VFFLKKLPEPFKAGLFSNIRAGVISGDNTPLSRYKHWQRVITRK
jgi:hypothetical protein